MMNRRTFIAAASALGSALGFVRKFPDPSGKIPTIPPESTLIDLDRPESTETPVLAICGCAICEDHRNPDGFRPGACEPGEFEVRVSIMADSKWFIGGRFALTRTRTTYPKLDEALRRIAQGPDGDVRRIEQITLATGKLTRRGNNGEFKIAARPGDVIEVTSDSCERLLETSDERVIVPLEWKAGSQSIVLGLKARPRFEFAWPRK